MSTAAARKTLAIVKPETPAETSAAVSFKERKTAAGVRTPPSLVVDYEHIPPGLKAAPDTGDRRRDIDLWHYRMSEATGSVHREVFDSFIGSLLAAVGGNSLESQEALTQAFAHMLDIGPRDGLEGMLAAQMVATFKAGMDELGIAQQAENSEIRASRYNSAAKLMRLFAQQMETLNRGRGKGGSEQRIVVERVEVQAGGQAVVGNVAVPGSPKKNA